MDTRTLALTVALVTAALALVMALVAAYRKQPALRIYSVGFASAATGFLLYLSPDSVTPWISPALADALVMLFCSSLPWGLRAGLENTPPWPTRYGVYWLVWVVVELGATFILPSYVARTVLFSTFSVVWAVEFFFLAGFRTPEVSSLLRRATVALALAYSAFHLIRVGLLLNQPHDALLLDNGNAVTVFTFLSFLFFAVLWGGALLALEWSGQFGKLEQSLEVLRAQAHTDELTGLLNRHRLEASMSAEMERGQRYRSPLSLILLDLDHFKEVNDTWGHPAGDAVLKRAAEVVRDRIRGADSLYRWGGEEFMILLPQTPLAGVASVAEKLRAALEATTFPVERKVTASFGVAEWVPPETRDHWVERLDLALYRAKTGGRNRVVVSQAGDTAPVARVRLDWRSDWESGNAVIDDEHRRLFDLANGLLDKALSAEAPERVGADLDALVKHVVSHFADEEKILAEVGYPGLEQHAESHRRLTTEALDLQAAFERGEADADAFFRFLVSKVVVGHLLTDDVRFFPYTKKAAK